MSIALDSESALASAATSPEISPKLALGSEERRYAYAVARRIVRNDHDAQDVVQEALLLAFRHQDSFRGQSKPRTWFHRIVVTTALSHLRSAARRRRHLDAVSAQPVSSPPTPEQALGRRELESRVAAEVGRLGEKYRAVLALRIEELSDAEISSRLSISVGSVKVRGHRARHQLRSVLHVEGAGMAGRRGARAA